MLTAEDFKQKLANMQVAKQKEYQKKVSDLFNTFINEWFDSFNGIRHRNIKIPSDILIKDIRKIAEENGFYLTKDCEGYFIAF